MNARGNSLLVEEKERNKVNKALPKLEKELQDLIQGRFFQTGFNNYVHLLDGSCWKRCHPLHTEWQRLISGVQSIMMEKSALVGKVGGVRLPPFTLFSITYKVAVYASTERADTLHVFHLYLICTLW
jgi:hypothetical protein